MARELSPAEAAMQRVDFDRPSEATPRPVDEEGIPFLTNTDVSPTFGITHIPNAKHVAYKDVPHKIEVKGTRPQNNRVWYKMSEVVAHLAQKAGHGLPEEKKSTEQLSFGPKHKHWADRYEKTKAQVQARRKAGENVGDLVNQPHPGNRDFHSRLWEGVRYQSKESPEHGDLQGQIVGTGPNIDNPMRNGYLRPVVSDVEDVTDFSNASRPSRNQRRGRS
jgi:hypothetical protein